jgi:hypothetical protein
MPDGVTLRAVRLKKEALELEFTLTGVLAEATANVTDQIFVAAYTVKVIMGEEHDTYDPMQFNDVGAANQLWNQVNTTMILKWAGILYLKFLRLHER